MLRLKLAQVMFAIGLALPALSYAGGGPQYGGGAEGGDATALGVGIGVGEGGDAAALSGSISGAHSNADSHSKSFSDSTSTGVGVGEGGDADAKSVSGSDNNIHIDQRRTSAERPVNSAAGIFSVGCQTAASAQGREAGINMIVDDASCMYLRLADAEYEMYVRARTPVEAEYHWKKLDHNLSMAYETVKHTTDTNTFAKNGMNVGMGTLGWGVFGYVIKLGLMAF